MSEEHDERYQAGYDHGRDGGGTVDRFLGIGQTKAYKAGYNAGVNDYYQNGSRSELPDFVDVLFSLDDEDNHETTADNKLNNGQTPDNEIDSSGKSSGYLYSPSSNSTPLKANTSLLSLPSRVVTQIITLVSSLFGLALSVILFFVGISVIGQIFILIAKTGNPQSEFASSLDMLGLILFAPWVLACMIFYTIGFILSLPLIIFERVTGLCLSIAGWCT